MPGVITQSVADSFKVGLATKKHDFTVSTGDAFKMFLLKIESALAGDWNAASTAYSATDEASVTNGTGYTAGGATLGTVSFSETGGTTTLDAADVTWTASGGDIGPATHAVIYSDTATNDDLIAVVNFDGAQTAGDGTDFKITFAASGILTFAQA